MSEYSETFQFLKSKSMRHADVVSWNDCKAFFSTPQVKEWIYLIKFSETIFSWGTASGDGDRLKKTGLLQEKLVGKYDRKVDYLMLRAVHGVPLITIFEVPNAVAVEQERRAFYYGRTSKGSCMRGFKEYERDKIAREVYGLFKTTAIFVALNENERNLLEDFVNNYWLAKLKHPRRKASFYYGDCLEPNFLDRELGRHDFIPLLEKIFSVKFNF